MRPNIDTHDYEVKMKAVRRFFEEGDKVKLTLRFRGREMAHLELGMQLLQKVREEVGTDRQGRSRAQARRPPDDDGAGAALRLRFRARFEAGGPPKSADDRGVAQMRPGRYKAAFRKPPGRACRGGFICFPGWSARKHQQGRQASKE